ncbi:MAG: hypothetical protein RBS89_10660 [Candidatus Delongbacteria bacterium]|jgi:SAM-dependent methyltransferase|nr:hypothetical protein [Candidatus Delongbacteria bacterium]
MFSTIKNNYEFYKKQYFRGDDIYCPFCSGFYKAEKYKLTRELSSLCPVCGSTAEERTVLLFLLSKTKMLSGELKILYVGEEGVAADFFRKYPNSDVSIYSSRPDFRMRDEIKKSDYAAGSSDIIICNYILEKHPSPNLLIGDLKKILKPDGIMIIQANVDQEREKTSEYSHMNYDDRLRLYGIPGNLRRYGKDYPEVIKSYGLNLSRLRFREGFEGLPEMSFNKDEIIYLAHSSEKPDLNDNNDDLESEMEEQKNNDAGDRFSAFIYTVFFIIPELVSKAVYAVISNIDEQEKNKGKAIYMIYVLAFGSFTFWCTFIINRITMNSGMALLYLFFSFPLFITVGGLGFMSMGMYFMSNYKAGFIKRYIVGFYVVICALLAVALSF